MSNQKRTARTMRAALLAELGTKALQFQRGLGAADKRTVKLVTAINFLTHVQRSPQRTGDEKNRLFRQIAQELARA